jgi:hypothetical protein
MFIVGWASSACHTREEVPFLVGNSELYITGNEWRVTFSGNHWRNLLLNENKAYIKYVSGAVGESW